jgi:hypothetical protein
MDHDNGIAVSLLPNSIPYEPVFAVDTRNDDVLWEMWAEGFRRAMALLPASWLAIVESGDQDAIEALAGLRSLIAIAGGESTLPKPGQDRLHRRSSGSDSRMGQDPLLLASRSQPNCPSIRKRHLQRRQA